MKDTGTAITTILLAVVGVAFLAVIVSHGANTPNVITSFGNAVKQMICQATAPVTGANCGSLTENVTSTIHF